MRKLCYTFFVLILALLCCKKPYNPPATSTSKSYLVVEGFINTGNDSTVIKISRTVKLTNKVTANPLINATVTVEGEQSGIYQLFDVFNNGHYNSFYVLNLPPTQRYRLRILTQEGPVYLSDYITAKSTPPIDSVGYIVRDSSVNLYVNTHDPANNTRYYLWDYDETWIFHAKYASTYVLDPSNNAIVARNGQQNIFYCFASNKSSNVILNSTEKLAQDVVYQNILTQIPLTSEKVESKYSILLRQYAVTKQAFEFYQNLKKNTEQLGSIFDAQPSEITGNIHNATNPNEPVVGYISMTNVQSKRIFVAHDALPGNVQPKYPYDCIEEEALFNDKQGNNDVQDILINPPIDYIPTSSISLPGGGIIGYRYSTRECVDCTLRGTTQTPPFWQ
jgi:hypothetical protein